MKKITILFALLLIIKIVSAQKINDLVVINLKSGFPIKGTITEIEPNKFIKVKLMNDEVFKVLYSEIRDIKLDEKGNAKVKARVDQENQIAEQEKQKAEQIKIAEQKRQNDSLIAIEKEKQRLSLKEVKRKEHEVLINQMHFNNYLYVGGGISVLSINENGIENMVKAANNIELFPIQNAPTFKGINLNVEYLVNYSKRKNLSFMLDISQLKSSIDAPYTKFDFVNNSATLNIGHCFYQKLLKASIGSGISITQNDIITSIEGRPDILCGRINYITVPLYLQLRYSSISRITFSLKPNLNLHLINSNLIPSYSLNAGLSLCIKKKNKN
jgi:putative N-acetylmannosamine-6-phosphate epimerase